jgi:hypothetical protein
MSTEDKISRRGWLAKAALFTATAGASSLLLHSGSAEGRASKSAVQYQDHPKRMQMCGMCKFFISANGRRGGMIWAADHEHAHRAPPIILRGACVLLVCEETINFRRQFPGIIEARRTP